MGRRYRSIGRRKLINLSKVSNSERTSVVTQYCSPCHPGIIIANGSANPIPTESYQKIHFRIHPNVVDCVKLVNSCKSPFSISPYNDKYSNAKLDCNPECIIPSNRLRLRSNTSSDGICNKCRGNG